MNLRRRDYPFTAMDLHLASDPANTAMTDYRVQTVLGLLGDLVVVEHHCVAHDLRLSAVVGLFRKLLNHLTGVFAKAFDLADRIGLRSIDESAA